MNSVHEFVTVRRGMRGTGLSGATKIFALLLLFCLGMARPLQSQVVPAADAGGVILSAGATASGYYLQYGERKLLGVAGFVDADTKRRTGIEAEARWLIFHQVDNVNTTTYTVGPRYHLDIGRFQPYAKGLVGVGEFNFPYNLAHGNYLVLAPGGGLDLRPVAVCVCGSSTSNISYGRSLPSALCLPMASALAFA